MNTLQRYTLVCGAIFTAACSQAHAQELHSIDLTPVDGTTWADSNVRLYFGSDLGYGNVTFTPVNGGSFANAVTPFEYNAAPYSPYNGPTTLSNGAIFAPDQESVFSIAPASNPGLSGFTMSVTLDSGVFPENSYFSVRSLGASGANSQYVQPLSGLAAPDSTQLPTDGSNTVGWTLADPANNLFGPAGNTSAAQGLAMEINGGTFSLNMLTTTGYNPGGVAMTVVTPVPESSGAVMIGLAGTLGLLRRRR